MALAAEPCTLIEPSEGSFRAEEAVDLPEQGPFGRLLTKSSVADEPEGSGPQGREKQPLADSLLAHAECQTRAEAAYGVEQSAVCNFPEVITTRHPLQQLLAAITAVKSWQEQVPRLPPAIPFLQHKDDDGVDIDTKRSVNGASIWDMGFDICRLCNMPKSRSTLLEEQNLAAVKRLKARIAALQRRSDLLTAQRDEARLYADTLRHQIENKTDQLPATDQEPDMSALLARCPWDSDVKPAPVVGQHGQLFDLTAVHQGQHTPQQRQDQSELAASSATPDTDINLENDEATSRTETSSTLASSLRQPADQPAAQKLPWGFSPTTAKLSRPPQLPSKRRTEKLAKRAKTRALVHTIKPGIGFPAQTAEASPPGIQATSAQELLASAAWNDAS
ncbi:hypothetical protein WJX84_004342 [Apatococcus fuscideae]|uniref:Uncharacterized protein n=1 Tax=Apatococcus fuscideae TaxID=2026836 RepID=A0AAW1TI87_9CHLO